MKKALLTIVVENQTQKHKAEKLAELLKVALGQGWVMKNVELYPKFENSYKIHLEQNLHEIDKDRIHMVGIEATDLIVSPWTVYYHKSEHEIELIYNKGENSKTRKPEFNVIRWAHWQLVNQ